MILSISSDIVYLGPWRLDELRDVIDHDLLPDHFADVDGFALQSGVMASLPSFGGCTIISFACLPAVLSVGDFTAPLFPRKIWKIKEFKQSSM